MVQIKSFQIKNYKGIVDTELKLSGKKGAVYTLVGLNESGKTTILEAINTFRPDEDGVHAIAQAGLIHNDKQAIVPKKEKANFNDRIVIAATVELSEDEVSEVVSTFKNRVDDPFEIEDSSIPRQFQIRKVLKYENSEFVPSKTSNFWDFSPNVRRKPARKFSTASSENDDWQEIVAHISGFFPRIIYFPTFLFDFPDRVLISDGTSSENPEANDYFKRMIQEALHSLNKGFDLKTHIVDRVIDNERQTPFAIWYAAFLQSDPMAQVRATLNELSKAFTKEVFGRWESVLGSSVRGKKIKLEPIIEAEPNGTGRKVFLRFEIEDDGEPYKVSERSLGFRWFFSFLLFTKYFQAGKSGETIFLFDEPAANLHSMAQNKLLDSLEEISGERNVVIFSTHSHHMINPLWLENTFIVTNGSPTDEPMVVDVDYDDRNADIKVQKYKTFVGQHSHRDHFFQPILDKLKIRPLPLEARRGGIITEGKSDFYILNWYKKYHGGEIEHDFVPVEGSGKAGAMISLYLGTAQDFVLLLDSDKAGDTAKSQYLRKLPVRENRIVQIGDVFPGKKEIEDLIVSEDKTKIKKLFNSSDKKIKDLILLAFSEDLYGKQGLALSDETLENLRMLNEHLTAKLKEERS